MYEEKQKRCEQELEELRQSCASRMRQASQRAQRAQQVLQLQVYQLQQEKKKLQEDFGQLLQEHELLESRCASIQRQQTQLGPRLEETKWEVSRGEWVWLREGKSKHYSMVRNLGDFDYLLQ